MINFALRKIRADRNTIDSSEAFRRVECVIHGAVEVLALKFETGPYAEAKLVLIESVSGTECSHVVPKIFRAKIHLVRAIGMRRIIEIDIQLLVLDGALKDVRSYSDPKDERQSERAR